MRFRNLKDGARDVFDLLVETAEAGGRAQRQHGVIHGLTLHLDFAEIDHVVLLGPRIGFLCGLLGERGMNQRRRRRKDEKPQAGFQRGRRGVEVGLERGWKLVMIAS
ncbi:MAG: hypothetical protein WDM96_06935 [Lacunisphaera sp.]